MIKTLICIIIVLFLISLALLTTLVLVIQNHRELERARRARHKMMMNTTYGKLNRIATKSGDTWKLKPLEDIEEDPEEDYTSE